ncbi:hypothetical protein [Leptolyngbya sp. NIES-2104]|uniref:hypothetical protein n=1 Tax=Leptolyngbya sp. NIES-2104 TaxID=1552121 RepID=UPI0006EC42F6|nr:hypothetical protein [Leptolyngbya sp. NIES-2104]GAP93720.1 hypothetical protein NIES2104_02270 [Leptolyngbya sp. NIES-2104]
MNTEKSEQNQEILWLVLSLGIAALYSGLAMRKAFSDPTMLQDDARIYLIWMQRFVDPELFPNDWMAKYFHSVTPWGLGTLYWLGSKVGIVPVVMSKLLPAVTSVLLAWFGYRSTLALFPVPIAGFFSAVILLQSCWQRDDLASAAPRSFWALVLVALVYSFIKRAWIAIALCVTAMALFCPLAAVLIAIWLGLRGVWGLWKRRVDRAEWVILGITIALLLPYVFSQSEFAPTVNAATARLMPEFQPGGRLPFFYPNPFRFWLDSTDGGFQVSFNPPLIGLGLLLPIGLRFKNRFPQLQQLNPDWIILPQLAGSGIVGFFLAHAMFVKLHFPSRYVTHSWRIAMAIAAGIVIVVLLERIKSWRSGTILVLSCAMLLHPHLAWKSFPVTGYGGGSHPALYEFLKTTPKTTLTAYLGEDASNLPMLSLRSTLAAQEYAIPFHLGYYLPMRQRAIDLINAQYSETLEPAKQAIKKYNITYWLLDSNAFAPDYLKSYRWFRLFEPHVGQAMQALRLGQVPAMQKIIGKCAIADPDNVAVLDSNCTLKN